MKTTLPLFLVLFILCISATASGETSSSFGLKIWGNKWDETVYYLAGGHDDYSNGSALLAGPELVIRTQNHWFFDAYYLRSLNKYKSSDWLASGDTMEFSQNEFDVRVGQEFFFFRWHSVTWAPFIEYKRIDAPAFYSNPSANLTNVDMGTWKMSGEGIGLLVIKSFDHGTEIYSSLALLATRQEFAFTNGGNSGSFTATGTVVDIGIKHAFSERLTADVGLKVQDFYSTLSTGDDDENTFTGFCASVLYAF